VNGFWYEHTPRKSLIDWPRSGRFLVPIVQLGDGSFAIPNDPRIIRLEFSLRDLEFSPRIVDEHVDAMQIGRALCCAGIPVFAKRGKVWMYCPQPGAQTISEAFKHSNGLASYHAERLLDHAKPFNLQDFDLQVIMGITGGLEYRRDGNAIVVEGVRYGGAILSKEVRRYVLLPQATLLGEDAHIRVARAFVNW